MASLNVYALLATPHTLPTLPAVQQPEVYPPSHAAIMIKLLWMNDIELTMSTLRTPTPPPPGASPLGS
jgi:hypothetical protein